MSIHVCKCIHNGREEYHLRYPGMCEEAAQELASSINGGALVDAKDAPEHYRATACIKACASIPTYQLTVEDGQPLDLGGMIDALRAENARLSAELAEARRHPSNELTWLYTHCRAIGMECKSESGKLEHDIALFTTNLKDELAAIRAQIEEAQRQEPAGEVEDAGCFSGASRVGRLYEPQTVGSKLYTRPVPAQKPVAFAYPQLFEHLEKVGCGTVYRAAGDGRFPLFDCPAPAVAEWMPKLYSWLARARFDNAGDEATAALYGNHLRGLIAAAPKQTADHIEESLGMARGEFANLSRHSRAMLLNVLWHHQGGSSAVGQPIRKILGIGEHDHLNDEQLAEAKWIDGLLAAASRQDSTESERQAGLASTEERQPSEDAKDASLPAPVRGSHIKKSWFHDAGAYARCSYCGRYSDTPKSLSRGEWPCECGKLHGWSGSFVAPTAESEWSDATPKGGA